MFIYMIDTETTGPIFKKDKLLEIGIVKFQLDMKSNALIPVSQYHTFIHTNKQPKSDFAKKYQTELYSACNKTKKRSHSKIRKEILDFLGQNPKLIGRNLYFDMFFLKEEKLINSTQIENNAFINEYDYNLIELNSFIEIEKMKINISEAEAIKNLEELDSHIKLESNQEHNAIYDCLRQAKIFNGFLVKYQIDLSKVL
jgi:DNA polymerase III epsilon subunit-like protein